MISNSCNCKRKSTLENMCRLCLGQMGPVENIFETNLATGDSVDRVLNDIFGLKVSLNDGLPPNICLSCLWRIRDIFAYKRNVLFASLQLQVILNKKENNQGRQVQEIETPLAANVIEVPFEDDIDIVEWKVPKDLLVFQELDENEERQDQEVLEIKTPEAAKVIEDRVNEDTLKNKEQNDSLQTLSLAECPDTCYTLMEPVNYLHDPVTEIFHEDSGDSLFLVEVDDEQDEDINHDIYDKLNEKLVPESRSGESEMISKCVDVVKVSDNGPSGKSMISNNELDKEESLTCSYCGVNKETKNELEEHISSVHIQNAGDVTEVSHKGPDVVIHSSLESTFHCKYCGYKFASDLLLKRHLLEHTRENAFKCNYCAYMCSQKENLITHLEKHIGQKTFKCKYCEYKSTRRERLKVHLRTHTGERPFQCKYCDYKSTTKGELVHHHRRHTGEKPFQCEHCSYSCVRKTILNRHLLIHSGEKPFQCDSCEYKSNRKERLKAHLRKHTGEKPYECSMCDFRTTTKRMLMRHYKHHTGEKPFQCDHCEYKCISSSVLKSHILIHTGEKPFKCSYCEYKCNRKENLKIHLKKHNCE